MPRRQYSRIHLPDPLYWFPFTNNANDIMGNFGYWNYTNNVTYSSNGAYFNGRGGIYKSNLSVQNGNFTTIHLKFMLPQLYTSGIYAIVKFINSNTKNINTMYAPDWSQDLNASVYNGNTATPGILSVSSIPLVANRFYALTIRQNFPNGITELFIDGQRLTTCNVIISQSTMIYSIYVGINSNSQYRYFKGYIKDLRFYNTVLDDVQISMLLC